MPLSQGKRFYEKTTCVTNQMLEFQYNHKKEHKIGRIECSILHFLMRKKDPVPFQEIIKNINVSNARITHLTDSLVQKNYITRTTSPKDRRVLLAQITPEGKKLAQRYQQKQIKLYDEILKELPEDDRNKVFTYLEKWKDFLSTQVK